AAFERRIIMRSALSAAEMARFRCDGLVVLPDQFSPAEVEALSEALERLRRRGRDLQQTGVRDGALYVMQPSSTGPSIHRVVWCGAAEPELAALGRDPRLLNPVGALLECTVVDQLINQAHFKDPQSGVEFPLHQDAWNRRYGTELWRDSSDDGAYIQLLLTIDPMTEDNGPLLYIPGSHRAGALLGDDRRARVDAIAANTPPRPIIAPPGALVLFGPFLVHGSAPNRSPQSRRVMVNGYARTGVNRRHYHGAAFGRRIKIDDSVEHSVAPVVLRDSSSQLRT
ncbi:MAG: phytanoyl-CoA dioxygenase family protein, partial [Myxococcota bacterium]